MDYKFTIEQFDNGIMYWTNDGYWFGNHEYAVKEEI